MKKIIDATKVAFAGKTGDDRCPESLPLPACMTSLIEAMGGEAERRTIRAHDRAYAKRPLYDRILGASGMAFALLWDRELCPSAFDVTQAVGLEDTLRRAFAVTGYSHRAIQPGDMDAAALRREVTAAIDRGAPLLAFGLFDPPECALVAGYDEDGKTLLGWSHFQDDAGLDTEENGMYRVSGWEESFWLLAIPGEKSQEKPTARDMLENALRVLGATQSEGYLAGQAAYKEWLRRLADAPSLDDNAAGRLYWYHRTMLFHLAELRCWGANFLREMGCPDAAGHFQAIHDACWQADAATQGKGAAMLRDPTALAEVIRVLREIQALDAKAAEAIAENIR